MSFDPEELERRAMDQTGLREFGPEPYRDGLVACLRALESEAELNPAGKIAAESGIVASLAERLRVEECLRKHPEILAQPLAPPIFIVGLPRTGTTALSHYLSEDPNIRSVRRWEVNNLTPPPRAEIAVDPRVAVTQAAFDARYRAMPALRTMLPLEPQDPAEHGPLLALTFRNLQYPTLFNVPSYLKWLLEADLTGAYRYFAKTLKLLQWKTPGAAWNLKNPPDLFALKAIKTVFPNSKIVWTHRDPAQSIPSLCSLAATLRGPTVDRIDKKALMRYMLRFQSDGVTRGLEARARIGESHFLDVHQKELAADTLGVVRRIYAALERPLTKEYVELLERRLLTRPRGEHGKHMYDDSEFGVSADEIRGHFKSYLTRFDMN